MKSWQRVGTSPGALKAWLACGVLLSFVATGDAAEFIVTDQAGQRVIAFDAESGAYTRTLVSGLMQPSAISWGPGDLQHDAYLYVTDLLAGTVIKIHPETGANSVFASGIFAPGSIHFDEWNGALYVGEFGNFPNDFGNEVFTYSANGTLIAARTVNAGPTGHSGLATDAGGNLYVSGFATDQFGSGHVLKYSTPWEPNPLSPLGVFAQSSMGLLQGAAGIAFDAQGNLFVAGLVSQVGTEGHQGRLVKFLVSGGVVTGEVDFDPTIEFPSGMTLLPDGSLVVTSLTEGQLYKYNTTTGARVGIINGDFDGDFNDDLGVDGEDLTDWRMAFGADATADADGDGDSDGYDFLAWQRGLGVPVGFSPSGVVYYESGQSAWAGSVPEPSSLALAALATLATARTRSRRRVA